MDGMNQNNNNPYGQSNDPYNHNPYQPQDNYGGQTVQPYIPAAQKRRANAKIIISCIAGALVVLIGIGVGALAYYRSTPSYKINKGFQNIAREIVQTSNPLTQKVGLNEIMEMMQEDGGHVETEINLAVEVPFFGETTVGVDTDYYKDVKSKELNADTSLSVMNFDFAHLRIYANDEVFCFSIPELYMEDLYIENKNVLKQYNRSIWANLYPIDAEDFSIDLFQDQNERVSMRSLRNMANTVGEFENDFNALHNAMTIEKVENGLYRVTVPQKEYDRLVKDLIKYYDKIYADGASLSIWAEMMSDYNKLIASDASLLFEINGQNRIESIILENPVEMLDGEASFEAELFFMGESRSIDKIQGKIKVNGVDGQSREMLWQLLQTADADSYQMDMDIKFNEGDETLSKVKLVANCDAVRDEFDVTCSYKDEESDMEFVMEGSLDDIVKGERFELEMDKVAINMDGEELFKITGGVSIEPLKKSIKPSVQPKTAFFEMTASDWEDIGDQIENGYGSLFNSFLW